MIAMLLIDDGLSSVVTPKNPKRHLGDVVCGVWILH